ncbi:MAG: hypothetical protein FWD47_13435 [Treponema sp.]|nr:hypothetical protein [Treponema sp.]
MNEYFDKCPLVNRGMSMGECYDVQMVAGNLIIPGILNFELDKDKAEEICNTCEFNQLKQKPEKTIKFGKPMFRDFELERMFETSEELHENVRNIEYGKSALNIDPELEKKVLERLREQKEKE